MGFVLMLGMVAGLGVSLVLLVPAIIMSVIWAKKQSRGYWLVHIGLSIVFMLMIGAVGVVLMMGDGKGGAPSGEDYQRWMIAFVLFGLAPGLGTALGLLCYLKPRPALAADSDPPPPIP